jgi:hypothetical protein
VTIYIFQSDTRVHNTRDHYPRGKVDAKGRVSGKSLSR